MSITQETRPTVDEAFGLADAEEFARAYDAAHVEDARRAYTAGLRILADLLDANPDVPLPYTGSDTAVTWVLIGPDAEQRTQAAAFTRMIGEIRRAERGAALDLIGQVAGLRVAMIVRRSAFPTTPAPDDAPSFFIEDDAHGDPTIWRHIPGDDPIVCLRRRGADPDLWALLTRSITAVAS